VLGARMPGCYSTLEASFYGYRDKQGIVRAFTKDDYRKLGRDSLLAIAKKTFYY
jgi:hypothetical protein